MERESAEEDEAHNMHDEPQLRRMRRMEELARGSY